MSKPLLIRPFRIEKDPRQAKEASCPKAHPLSHLIHYGKDEFESHHHTDWRDIRQLAVAPVLRALQQAYNVFSPLKRLIQRL